LAGGQCDSDAARDSGIDLDELNHALGRINVEDLAGRVERCAVYPDGIDRQWYQRFPRDYASISRPISYYVTSSNQLALTASIPRSSGHEGRVLTAQESAWLGLVLKPDEFDLFSKPLSASTFLARMWSVPVAARMPETTARRQPDAGQNALGPASCGAVSAARRQGLGLLQCCLCYNYSDYAHI
jgi:hypothetical protein